MRGVRRNSISDIGPLCDSGRIADIAQGQFGATNGQQFRLQAENENAFRIWQFRSTYDVISLE
jgi:hypothetical protein